MTKPTETTEPAAPAAPKGKLVSVVHRDLHAAAEIYDILDDLPTQERRRVLEWCMAKYNMVAPPLPSE